VLQRRGSTPCEVAPGAARRARGVGEIVGARKGFDISAMEHPKVRKFKGAGIELNCVDYGGEGRPPMFLVHGGAAHARWWDFVAPALTGRFHVLALDQRGHGDSPWSTQ
jgi:pimeloyl-ACP methyl ester carboxylesterase